MRLDELKRLAEAATPGPWQWGDACLESAATTVEEHDDMGGVIATYLKPIVQGEAFSDADGAFIAAANPDTVLRLVGIVRDLAAIPESALTFEDTRGCVLCDETHTEQCPWRRAVELTQEQP